MSHKEVHPLSGEVLQIVVNGTYMVEFEVEDWADRVQPGRGDDEMVYGRITNPPEGYPLPLSRTFRNEQLQIHHA